VATDSRIGSRVDIGHVHLKAADLERAIGFHGGVLGFGLQQRYGDHDAFLSAGGCHHHNGLNAWEPAGSAPPPRARTGLHHVTIRDPDRRAPADAVRRVPEAGIALEGAGDHGMSEAIHLRDSDDIGIELSRDRPREEWRRARATARSR
jgi:catechol 2,3-dioxygenase